MFVQQKLKNIDGRSSKNVAVLVQLLAYLKIDLKIFIEPLKVIKGSQGLPEALVVKHSREYRR